MVCTVSPAHIHMKNDGAIERLTVLPNIGATVAERLVAIGVRSRGDLEMMGPAEAWRRMAAANPGKTLPVCYYLYSLEAALRECHWNDLPDEVKAQLGRDAKGSDA